MRVFWGEHPMELTRPLGQDGLMTFGVIGKEEPLLAELFMLAFESAGHECLLLKDTDHATRVLHAIQVDAIVLDINLHDPTSLDWLESMAATWPDLPSRTLLLANAAVTPEIAERIRKLGADLVLRPLSILGVEGVITERVHKARVESAGRGRLGSKPASLAEFVN